MDKLNSTIKGTVSHSLPFRRAGSISSTAPNDSLIDAHPAGTLPFSGHLEQLATKVSTNPTATTTGTITVADTNRSLLACYRRGNEAVGGGTRVLTTTDIGVTYTETLTLNDLDTIANGDWIVIVADAPFWGVFLDVANVNGSTNTMQVAYWDGEWVEDLDVAALELEDNTHDGTGSLANDGTVRISKYWSTRMTPGTFGTVSGYAMRIGFVTAALDSATSLTAAYAIGDHTHYIEVPHSEIAEYSISTLDGGTTLTASHGVGAHTLSDADKDVDYLLVGSKQPFMGVGVNVTGTNSSASTLTTVNYWGGSSTEWTGALTVASGTLTDGTASSLALDQDGLLLWDPGVCSDMQQTTIGGITAYWVQIMWDVDLDSSVTTVSLYTVRAENWRYPHYFTKYERTQTNREVLVDSTARFRHSDSVSMRAVQIDVVDTSYATADVDSAGLYTNHSGAERSSDPTLETND